MSHYVVIRGKPLNETNLITPFVVSKKPVDENITEYVFISTQISLMPSSHSLKTLHELSGKHIS